MGHFIRPKDTNRVTGDETKTKFNAETIGVVQEYENEYFEPTAGFDPTVTGLSGAKHFRDPTRREASPHDPLPTSGRSAGISGPGVRGAGAPIARRGSMPRKGR